MAELDKDPLGSSRGTGAPSPIGEGGTTWTAGRDSGSNLNTGGQAQSFDETKEKAKQQAADMAQRAKAQGRDMLSGQKDRAAGQVDSVARALRNTADQLGREDQSETGRYIGYAAEHLESFGQRLRDKDIDGLLHDAQDIARRSPMAFFAGSVAAGFLLARFLKSSSQGRSDPQRYSGQHRMAEGLQHMRGDDPSSYDTRTSYMDNDAAGTQADSGSASADLRTTMPAPDGGATESAPLPTGETTRGGNYGL